MPLQTYFLSVNYNKIKSFLLKLTFLALVAFFLCSPRGAVAQETLILENIDQSYLLSPYMTFWEDTDRTLTIKDTIAISEEKWQPVPHQENAIDFGYTDSAYWLRFKIKTLQQKEWLLHFKRDLLGTIDLIEIYLPQEDGNYKVKRGGGSLYLFINKAYRTENRFSYFLLPLPERHRLFIYELHTLTGWFYTLA